MSPRDALHQLVDELPESELPSAARLLEALRGRVVVTLGPLPEQGLEPTEDDLEGAGLTAEEIASSPEVGAWGDDREMQSGAERVEALRRASSRHSG